MSYNYAGGVPYKAITLAFFAGLIEILAGLFNLGFLIQFISSPVITAFSSAVSIQVITSQVKGFFGIKFKGRGFVQVWVGIFKNIQQINFYDALVGLISMAILYFLKVNIFYYNYIGNVKYSRNSMSAETEGIRVVRRIGQRRYQDSVCEEV